MPDSIAHRFREVTTQAHLAALLRDVLRLDDPEAEVGWLRPRLLAFLAFHGTRRYRSFSIPKRSGGRRELRAPTPKLKAIQRALNACFNEVFDPHRNAYGFVPGRSVADNARRHVRRRHLLNVDLEDFFPSTSFRRVKTVLGLEPFALTGPREELAFLIANLCCDEGRLPQGAPTSPTLTNVVCQRLDRRLTRLARQHQAVYTRYADDLTFSSNHAPLAEAFEGELRVIIQDEGYRVNEKKLRRRSCYERQEVTGLIVNDKVNVPRRFVKDLRYRLHVWERFGLEKAQADFHDRHSERYASLYGRVPKLEHVVAGQIAYLAMVRGPVDPLVRRTHAQLTLLAGKLAPKLQAPVTSARGVHPPPDLEPMRVRTVRRILERWEGEGFEAAFREALSKDES